MILVFFVRTSHGGSNRTRPARPILRVGRTAADVSKGNREERRRTRARRSRSITGARSQFAHVVEDHLLVRPESVPACDLQRDAPFRRNRSRAADVSGSTSPK